MAINYYNQPAQAQFTNTYVPMPIDDLNNLAQTARQDRDRNEQKVENYITKFGDFQSRSQRDMDTWNNEVTGRVRNVAEQIASNPDAIKGEEGRMLVSSLINNTDYGLLSQLRRNAQNLEEGYQTYDRRWNDDTLSRISNWDTAQQGLYKNNNVEFKTLHDLVDPYVSNLDMSFDPNLSNGQWDYYSITPDRIAAATASGLTELYNDPITQRHIRRLGLSNATPEQQISALQNIAMRTQGDRSRIKREERRDYARSQEFSQKIALEKLKQANANARAAMRKNGNSSTTIDGVPNRSEHAMNNVINSVNKKSPILGSNKSYNSFVAEGRIDTGNPILDSKLTDYRGRLLDLSNKYRNSQEGGPKLTTDETKELGRLQSVMEDVARVTPEMDELNTTINTITPVLEKENRFLLQELRVINRELTSNRFSALSPDLFNNGSQSIDDNIRKDEQINNLLNKRIGEALQLIQNSKELKPEEKVSLLKRLESSRIGNTSQKEIQDYLNISLGSAVEEIQTTMQANGQPNAKKTGNIFGSRAETANKIRVKDYSLTNGIGSVINPVIDDYRGRFARRLFENPTSFDLHLDTSKGSKEVDTAVRFGGSTVPVIIESDQGRVALKKGKNFTSPTEYAASVKINIPTQSIKNYLDEEDIQMETKTGRKTKVKDVKVYLEAITGSKPQTKIINGVEYYVIDGEVPLFDNTGDMQIYNHTISDRGVRFQSKIPNTNDTPGFGYFTDEFSSDEYIEDEE